MSVVVVTGAGGFLGGALIEALISQGHEVVGIDRHDARFIGQKTLNNSKFKFIKGEINAGGEDLLKEMTVDVIFHLAAKQPSAPGLSYEDFYKGNVESMLGILALARKNKTRAVIYTSTITVLSNQNKKMDEDAPCEPSNYYSLTKYIAEHMLRIESKNNGIKAVIVRFPSLMGKHHRGGLVNTYYGLAKTGADIEVFSKGKRLRNILYVSSAVEILIKVLSNLDRLESCELFMAGSKDSLTTIDIARTIKDLLKSSSRIVPVDKSPAGDCDIVVDTAKAQRSLGFAPISIAEGLKMYIAEKNNEV